MNDADPLTLTKHRGRQLHRRAQQGEPDAVAFLRRRPPLAALEPSAVPQQVKRRHCLEAIARHLGFREWVHAKAVLCGNRPEDLGTLMYAETGGAIWNIWSASYDEARAIRHDGGGFLLPYRRQFMIVESGFIRALSLDPRDDDWDRIERDWVRPPDADAWARLTSRRIIARCEGLLAR